MKKRRVELFFFLFWKTNHWLILPIGSNKLKPDVFEDGFILTGTRKLSGERNVNNLHLLSVNQRHCHLCSEMVWTHHKHQYQVQSIQLSMERRQGCVHSILQNDTNFDWQNWLIALCLMSHLTFIIIAKNAVFDFLANMIEDTCYSRPACSVVYLRYRRLWIQRASIYFHYFYRRVQMICCIKYHFASLSWSLIFAK